MKISLSKPVAVALAGVVVGGVALVSVATASVAAGAAYSGQPIGTLTFAPASGNDLTAMNYTSSGGCPSSTQSFESRLFGFGLPDEGEVVTSRTQAGFSATGPISSSFGNTPRFYADKNGAPLQGRYDIVLRCAPRLGAASSPGNDYRGAIRFTSNTAYVTDSATPSPAASTSAPPTATTAPSPATSPGATAPNCSVPATVALERSTIVAGTSARVNATAPVNSVIDLFAYTRPSSTFRLVRSAEVGSTGKTAFQLAPPANSRLYALVRGCTVNVARDSKALNVSTRLTLTAVRNGVRNYTFSGNSFPARRGGIIVRLYQVTKDGRQTLITQTRASATNGRWTIRRTFAGTGQFNFVVRTGQDALNAAGASSIRPTLIR